MIEKIIEKIKENIYVKQYCIVAIDGCGGAGKSTLAEFIVSKYGDGQIIHMDDFYKPSNQRSQLEMSKKEPGADYDLKRLIQDVILPIIINMEAKYQRYDWVTDKLAEWHNVIPNGLIIIEGVYSISELLYTNYDIKIFVECNKELRLKRGLERDGENALDFWEQWMIGENKYLIEQNPRDRSDFIISGEDKY